MTSWHLRCISGFDLCTEAKSNSSLDFPDSTDDADPPPNPIK